eukprot:1867621-Prymnesium_polylepis.1
MRWQAAGDGAERFRPAPVAYMYLNGSSHFLTTSTRCQPCRRVGRLSAMPPVSISCARRGC